MHGAHAGSRGLSGRRIGVRKDRLIRQDSCNARCPDRYRSRTTGRANAGVTFADADGAERVRPQPPHDVPIVGVYCYVDTRRWRTEGDDGTTRPGRLPYGLEHLSGDGATAMTIMADGHAPGRLYRKMGGGLASRSLLFPVGKTLTSRSELTGVDVALAILEQEGYAHALLKRVGARPWRAVPLVLLACWLADDVLRMRRARLAVVRKLLESVDLIVFWSSNQAQIYREVLHIPEERLFCVPFGIETDFYTPISDDHRGEYVFSAGRDRGRDYETLLRAAELLPDVPFRIAAPTSRMPTTRVPSNVELLGEISHLAFRDALRRAGQVVVCSHPSVAYPTGQSVLLNAWAVGTPTAATATEPLRDYIRDGSNAITFRPRDPEACAVAIDRLTRDRRLATDLAETAKREVAETYNSSAMWAAIAAKLAELRTPR